MCWSVSFVLCSIPLSCPGMGNLGRPAQLLRGESITPGFGSWGTQEREQRWGQAGRGSPSLAQGCRHCLGLEAVEARRAHQPEWAGAPGLHRAGVLQQLSGTQVAPEGPEPQHTAKHPHCSGTACCQGGWVSADCAGWVMHTSLHHPTAPRGLRPDTVGLGEVGSGPLSPGASQLREKKRGLELWPQQGP